MNPTSSQLSVGITFFGMIPIFMMPLLNVLKSEEVCICYFKEVTMMFAFSIMLAIAVEYSSLHIRIALTCIKCIGVNPRLLHLSIVSVTCFLSFWMMNTAVTAMMIPIVRAIIEELSYIGIGSYNYPQTPEEIESQELPRPTAPTTAYFIGVAYASSLGGLCTVIGTGTTLTYRGILESRYPQADDTVDFVSWMLFNTPMYIALNFFMWFWMQIVFMGLWRPASEGGIYMAQARDHIEEAKVAIYKKYDELGKVTFHETMVGIFFTTAVFLWFFRRPLFMTGWSHILTGSWLDDKPGQMKNSVAAVGMFVLMIMVPQRLDFLWSFSKNPDKRPTKSVPGLITWKVANEKFPWGVLFLLGGGFAMSKGGTKSGMASYLAEKMSAFSSLNKYGVSCLTTLICSLVTELASNMATVNLLMPIFFSLSDVIKCNPILLGHPAAIAASHTFLLPVGTPMNAMVSAYANIRTPDFFLAGIMLKIAAYGLLMAAFLTYGQLFWTIDKMPNWAKDNTTSRII